MKNKFLKSLVILSAGYAFIENRFILKIRHENSGKNGQNDIKIAHISDLHRRRFGENNSRICRIMEQEKPDIILITGDIISRTEENISGIKIFLENLRKTAPVFLICGNHEQSLPEKFRNEFTEIVRKSGINLLENDSVSLEIKNRNLIIYGLKESYGVYKNGDSYRNLEKITPEIMGNLLGKIPENKLILLMAHNPFFADAYSGWGADYTFSGHVHGGIIRIFGKGILSPERKLFPEYSKGIYKIGKMNLCVSGGLGKFRLFNPPEIVIYKI
ncbi:MAG: metallophosphoesterase [Ruminococcus sp.]|nr:metallophosphoesterase [Ruminococcus sp.]